MFRPRQQIGVRIRRFRIRAGLTQDALAEHVGVGAGQVVSRWERGLQVPRLDTAAAIADTLDVPVDALVHDEVQVQPNPPGSRARLCALLDRLPDEQVAAVYALVDKLAHGRDRR